MTQVVVVIALGVLLMVLVQRRWIGVDLSLPWFASLVVLATLSLWDSFVGYVASVLGILYPPIAIVFLTIFILVGLLTVALMSISRIRHRQIQIIRQLGQMDLRMQEKEMQATLIESGVPSGTTRERSDLA
jgi:hypothetical protein